MLEEIILKVAKEVITRASVGPAFDISTSLRKAYEEEDSETAKVQLGAILENIKLSTSEKIAVCQDTGFPNFYIKLGDRFPVRSKLYEIFTKAV
ncbi:MAG: fumarate hydratase, partial [Pyrobaculum sp.]